MTNKKILFISSFNPDVVEINGVAKKMLLEIKTFLSFGFDVDYTEINTRGVYINSDGELKFCVSWRGSYHKTFVALYKKLSQNNLNYDIIYFRYEHISLSMLSFFKQFKRGSRRLVIGELPTYMRRPYGSSSLKDKGVFYLKRAMNSWLPKDIDYLATFSEHKKLFKIKTINIENFTDLTSLRTKKSNLTPKNECHLLVLAQLTPAHGVDLVIRGLYEYYKEKRNIKCYLHIVGDGSISQNLKTLSANLDLENNIRFYGALGGERLNEVFDKCDVGIGALAIFRKGSCKLSELKIREYTARGLPFVYNAYEPQVEGKFFCKKLEFKEKPVDIDSIVSFYQQFDYSEATTTKMRRFAEKEFTAEVQLRKVFQKISEYYRDEIK